MTRARAVTVLVALVVALGSGCGDDEPSGDGDPTRDVDGVELSLDTDLTADEDALSGTVEVRNDGDSDLWVFDGMAVTAGAGTRYDPSAFALLDAGDDVLEVAFRAVDPPEDVDLDALAVLAVRRLAAGDSAIYEIEVPLPPTPTGPYAEAGQTPPDDPTDAVVCVGASPGGDDDPAPRTGDGVPDDVEALATHGARWIDSQAITCSDRIELP